MKCPMCGGDGITDKFTPNVGRCIKCNGSGEIEETNYEFMQFCTIEELADVLTEIACEAYYDGLDEKLPLKHNCKHFMKWLKEKHE